MLPQHTNTPVKFIRTTCRGNTWSKTTLKPDDHKTVVQTHKEWETCPDEDIDAVKSIVAEAVGANSQDLAGSQYAGFLHLWNRVDEDRHFFVNVESETPEVLIFESLMRVDMNFFPTAKWCDVELQAFDGLGID